MLHQQSHCSTPMCHISPLIAFPHPRFVLLSLCTGKEWWMRRTFEECFSLVFQSRFASVMPEPMYMHGYQSLHSAIAAAKAHCQRKYSSHLHLEHAHYVPRLHPRGDDPSLSLFRSSRSSLERRLPTHDVPGRLPLSTDADHLFTSGDTIYRFSLRVCRP